MLVRLHTTFERTRRAKRGSRSLLPHFNKLWEKLICPSHQRHTELHCPGHRPLPRRNSDLRSPSDSSYCHNNHAQTDISYTHLHTTKRHCSFNPQTSKLRAWAQCNATSGSFGSSLLNGVLCNECETWNWCKHTNHQKRQSQP